MGELGLLVCVMGTTFGLYRVFQDLTFMPRLAGLCMVAVGLAALLRRRGIGLWLSLVAHSSAGAVLITNLFIGDSTWFGIPTLRSLRAAQAAMTESIGELRTSVPPLDQTTGLMLLVAIGLWALIVFADTAAFRAGAPLQAVLPLGAAFVALGIPDSDVGRTASAAVFAFSLLVYALTIKWSSLGRLRWVEGPTGGSNSVLRATAVTGGLGLLAAVAVSIAAVDLTPHVSLRHQRSGADGRVVTTPFVGIRNLLGPRSNSEMFRITAAEGTYWRTTALDRYDESRDIWVSSGTYSRIDGELERNTSRAVPTRRLVQDVKIAGLTGPWLPAAFEPVLYEPGPRATFNEVTSSLITAGDPRSGSSYGIESLIPEFDQIDLDAQTREGVDSRRTRHQSDAPEPLPATRTALSRVVTGSRSPFEMMLNLQNWFRSEFEYDEQADYSGSSDPLDDFLIEKKGFCQQFSSAFALIARYYGLPSRVAVGFTMGDPRSPDDTDTDDTGSPDSPDSADTHDLVTYIVRGRHAHAWPEVYFAGVGWVPFEPTPGRGNPATEPFTGVPAGQAEPEDESVTASTSIPTTSGVPATSTPEDPSASGSPESQSQAPPDQVPGASDSSPGGSSSGGSRGSSTLAALALLALVLAAPVLTLRRRSRRRRASRQLLARTPDERVADSWKQAVQSLSEFGLVAHQSQTPLEIAAVTSSLAHGLAADSVPESVEDTRAESMATSVATLTHAIERLAQIETLRRYAAHADQGTASDGLVEEAAQYAEQIAESVDALRDLAVVALGGRPARLRSAAVVGIPE